MSAPDIISTRTLQQAPIRGGWTWAPSGGIISLITRSPWHREGRYDLQVLGKIMWMWECACVPAHRLSNRCAQRQTTFLTSTFSFFFLLKSPNNHLIERFLLLSVGDQQKHTNCNKRNFNALEHLTSRHDALIYSHQTNVSVFLATKDSYCEQTTLLMSFPGCTAQRSEPR